MYRTAAIVCWIFFSSDAALARCEIVISNEASKELMIDVFDPQNSRDLMPDTIRLLPRQFLEVEIEYGCGKVLALRYQDQHGKPQTIQVDAERIQGSLVYEVP